MQYNISTKNVKQSISHLGNYLKEKGYVIPYSILLEAFAKSLYFKNYNTLEAIAKSCQVIQYIKPVKRYCLEIDIQLPENTFKKILYSSFHEAKCSAQISSIRSSIKNNSYQYYIEIDMQGLANNTLTAFFLLTENLKASGVMPTRMEYARISIEKENLMGFFHNK